MRLRLMRSVVGLAALIVVGTPTVGTAQAFFSTGVNVVGVLDQSWTVSTGNGAFLPGGPFTPGVLGYGGGVNWISNTAGASNGFAPFFVFQQSFDLTGYDPTSADLKFEWGCDDVPNAVPFTPVFSLNGGAQSGSGTCGAYAFGNVVDVNSGFVAGVNTMDFYVMGNGITDAFELQTESFTANDAPVQATPEPATWSLLATGLIGLVGIRRLRKR